MTRVNKTTRLRLDWSLDSDGARAEFVKTYLEKPMFRDNPPTEDELAMMGDYILWGKNKQGLTGKQQGLDLRSKHGTWDDHTVVESLDALMETPTFQETSVYDVGGAPPTARKKAKFNRKEALDECPESMKQIFGELFREIDEVDLEVNLYEVIHGKKPKVREALVKNLGDEEIGKIAEKVGKWTQFMYLKKRHLLVELRQEQYVLRDSYRGYGREVNSAFVPCGGPVHEVDWDNGWVVLPLGLAGEDEEARWVFGTKGKDGRLADKDKNICDESDKEKSSVDGGDPQFCIMTAPSERRSLSWLDPEQLTEEQLAKISARYWAIHNAEANLAARDTYIDFRKATHIYEFIKVYHDLCGCAEDAKFDSNLPALLETFKFYVDLADLSDIQRVVLNYKIEKKSNIDIALAVNKKYGKSYTVNYISTIFTQKVVAKIAAAAEYHLKVIENIFYPENFKKCSVCGQVLLLDTVNFARKARSKDGFNTKCKRCEHDLRIAKRR